MAKSCAVHGMAGSSISAPVSHTAIRRSFAFAPTIVAMAVTFDGPAHAASPDESCARLANVPVPATSIMLPTSGAVVMSAVMTPATGADVALVAEHCKVKGAVKPVDPSAPDILFEL